MNGSEEWIKEVLKKHLRIDVSCDRDMTGDLEVNVALLFDDEIISSKRDYFPGTNIFTDTD